MGPLLLGPSAKLDLDNLSFVAADPRRPCASPGLDQAWLYHRGSILVAGKIAVLPAAGSAGPEWWEGPNGWGVRGALVRIPKVLLVCCFDTTAAVDWVTSNFQVFSDAHVAVAVIGPGSHPFLIGCPLGADALVDQDGANRNPLHVPTPIDPALYRGGKILVAAITKFRAAFRPDDGLAPNPNADYTSNEVDNPAYSGYERILDSSIPTPITGFTVYTKDAIDHRQKMNDVADNCQAYKTIFYQGAAEYPSGSVGGVDSSLIGDATLNDLLANDPRLQRKPYTAGDLGDAFDQILTDATEFFSLA